MAAVAMTAIDNTATPGWRRFGALMLAVAAVGLPINELHTYALLVALAVVMLTGGNCDAESFAETIAGV